jgi:hypothetical protein
MLECLRFEFRPLGVRVITGMLGAVHTPIHENAGELVLPASSYYESLRDHINDVRKGTKNPGSVGPEIVCKTIVSDITRGKTGLIWRGGFSSLVG